MSRGPTDHAASVETGYLALYRLSTSPRLAVAERDGGIDLRSDVAAPIFNGVVAPRLPARGWEERANELLDAHMERGLPFQWWTGPLSHDERVEGLLAARGMVSSGGAPGMYLELSAADLAPLSAEPSLTVQTCASPETWAATLDTIVAGFEMDLAFAEPFADILSAMSPADTTTIHVLDGDVPVGGGTVAFVDGVAGLYNIAVLPSARRRGIGRAITVELLRLGRDAGCHGAMLHASELGFPVYAALGFREVGRVHMRVWMPGAPSALAD